MAKKLDRSYFEAQAAKPQTTRPQAASDTNAGSGTKKLDKSFFEVRAEEAKNRPVREATPEQGAAPAAETTQPTTKRSRTAVNAGGFSHSGGKIDKRKNESLGETLRDIGLAGASGSAGAFSGAAGLFNEASAKAGQLLGKLIGDEERGEQWNRDAQKIAEGNYETGRKLSEYSRKKTEQAKSGKGAVGQFLVDLGTQGVQMGGDAVLAPLTGGGTLIPLFARSVGGAALESSDSDASLLRRGAYAVGAGGVEVLTEKMFDGLAGLYGAGAADEVVDNLITRLAKSDAGRTALEILSSAAGEGAEEVVSDLINPALQALYNEKSIGQNYDALQASDVLYDFLVGAAMGGLGGVVENGVNKTLSRFDNTLGENGRKAIRTSYQEGADTVEHIRDFVPAYNAGVEGKPNPNPKSAAAFAGYAAGQNDARVSTETAKNVSDVSSASTQTQDAVTGPLASSRVRSETMQSEITPPNTRGAQSAPQTARESGLVYDDYVMREMDSSTASEINTVAKALGVRVRMADEVLDGKANGQIEGSDILIAKDATDPVMQVVGHEWTHRVQQLAPEQYRAFRDAVAAIPDVAEAANILHRQYNRMGVEINSEQALDEATANYAGEMIANTDVLNDFIQRHREDRTLLEKLRDAIHEIVGKLTGRAKRQAQTAEGLLQQAYEAAAKNSKKAATEGGGARYHLNEQFSQQFDEWNSRKVDNKGVGSFLVGTTSEALQSVGVADCEIYWRKAKVAKIMSEHPAMTADVIKSVPDILENPIIVMQSQTVANRITIFGETVDADGKPVLAVLELSPQNKRGEIQDFSVIASAYGKNNAQQMLDNSDILYVDPNKKRTDSWLGLLRLQLPSSLTNYGSIGSVTLVDRNVNGNLSFGAFGEGSGKTAMQEAFERAQGEKRYSLKKYTDEEKKQHIKDADGYFGHTYKWAETGYITTDGKRLDFSGRHEGGSGGYRSEDHRDIRDALGYSYGGDDYSGAMVQFMSEGNIRISPESGGINLSVMPTKAQASSLSDFISHERGEVILDLDTPDGQTVSSTEYPRGTHANKVLADIKAYFEDGTPPQVSETARFHSLKGTENAQELAALKRENETLRGRVEYWKGQTHRSDGVRTDRKGVERTAKQLVRDYGAEVESGEIVGDLQGLYDYIARGGDESGELTYTEARKRADAIAEKIAENSMARDEELYQEYSELRKFLRTTKLTLSAEDAASITDYAELRKSLFGKVNLSKGEHTNVDRVYAEMADSYPEFFSEMRESNVSDQVQRIADVANSIYNVSEYNPFEGYMGQAVASISNDIMERFFDLPQAKKTFADRMTAQVQEARQSGRQAARDAMLAGQMAQGRADAARLRNTQQALAKERDRRAAQVQELRERFREKDETRRDSQSRRTLRAKIVRHANTLSQKLLRPTDKQHIPEEMRSAVAAVLNSINQESRYTVDGGGKRVYDNSGTPTKRTAAFRALKERYQNVLAEGGDMVIDPSLFGSEADGVKGGFDRVIAMGDKRLSELSAGELQTMWQVVKAVEKSVSTAGKLLSGGKYETTQEMADAFRSDTRTRRRKLGGNRAISLETPYTFFAHYGQTGRDIYRMLRNAQDAQEIMARDIAEKTRRVLGERATAHGVREAVTSARGNNVWKLEAETHDFTTARGDSLTLTTSQVMELYLLGKRKQAQDHLMSGGIYQPEIRDAATGKVKVPRGTQAVFLTAEDVGRIASLLTAEQKKIADGLQQLTTDTLAKYGNDASMKAYGYRKFTEKDYWPIRSAKERLHSSQEKDAGNVRSIKNIGMAQQVTPHAKTPLEIGSVFDTYARHASDMIDYAAWLNPMEDANRLFNFRYKNSSGADSGVTLKGLLDEKGGQGSQRYWMKLMGDIQNGIGTKDFEPITDVFAKGVGKFKGAAVGANIRVVIQQPTAFFRASAVLDPADMAKGLTGGVTKGSGWEKALEHSPIAMRKDVGSFDISSPYTMKERFYGKEGAVSKLNDLAGAAAGKADAVTWGKLWNACEWQVKREKPELRAGSNAFYEAVNEVFTDMIDQTQVVDGILQRSNIMRGKSTLSQQATAFMGEPIMSLNVFLRSYDRFRYENDPKKRAAAMKNVGRAATALLVTNVVNAMAQSVVDALRDDDRDKDYWEKFFSAFTGIEGDEEGAAEKIAHVVLNGNVGDNMNPVSQIPFVKDILSLTQGYSVARPDMEIFSDLVDASSTFIKSIGGNGKKTRAEATLGLFAAAGKLFGLPAYNIKRDLNAALRTLAQASGSIPYQYEVEKFTYNIGYAGNKSRFMGILYDALEQGDYTSYDHIRRDLMESMGLDGKAITSALKTRYNKEVAEDPQHKLPQKALDMLGIRAKYAAPEEPEDKFGADDLAPAAYGKYEKKKADTYRVMENSMTGSAFFKGLEASVKDKALNNAEDYAEKTALAEASGGKYEITTKWVLDAQEAEKQYRIPPATYAALRAAASECTSLKDKDGETIKNSKGVQVMDLVYRSGLTEKQRNAMFEYLDVPKGIQHYNKACVAEQLEKMRKKAK